MAVSQGLSAAPRNWKRQGTHSALESPEGAWPCWLTPWIYPSDIDLDFWPSQLRKKTSKLITKLVVICYRGHRKLIRRVNELLFNLVWRDAVICNTFSQCTEFCVRPHGRQRRKKKCSSFLQELCVIAGETRWHSWDTSRGCRVWVSAMCWVVQLCPLFATPLTVAHQAPLSMGFSRQEYWSGLPCSPPRDLPNSGIEPKCLMSPAPADEFFTTSATWESLNAL